MCLRAASLAEKIDRPLHKSLMSVPDACGAPRGRLERVEMCLKSEHLVSSRTAFGENP